MTDIRRRISGSELAYLCGGEALGAAVMAVQPMWVAGMLKAGTLTGSRVGWLASGELFSIAIGALAVSVVGPRSNTRKTVAWAASLVAIANAVAMVPSASTLIIGRLVSGVGTGVVEAFVIGVAARSTNAPRVLAIMQLPVMLLSSLIYFTSPSLTAHYGPAAVFGFLLGLASVEVIFANLGAPGIFVAAKVSRGPGVHWLAATLGCLGIINVNGAFAAVWTYIVVIGTALGFSTQAIGNALTIAPPVALLAPILSSILGDRAGLLAPIICSLFVMASVIFFLVHASSPFLLGTYAAVFIVGATLYVPYAIALLARVDGLGRLSSAVPVIFMVGGAVGAALGSWSVARSVLQIIPIVVSSMLVLAVALFVGAFALTSGSLAGLRHRTDEA